MSGKWILALGFALSAIACGALFGDGAQCATDSDCGQFGASYACGAEGTCVTRAATSTPGPAVPIPADASTSTSTPAPTDAGATTAPPASVASITITPATITVPPGGKQQFTATAKDASGNAITPAPVFVWSVAGGGTIDVAGLFTAGTTTATPVVTVKSGTVSATANLTIPITNVNIGETTILTVDDSGNSNLLLAQEATLAQAATLRSLSFYVATAAGQLRLGIYDATGPGGGPGAKKAETAEMTAAAGWNAVNVVTPVLLPAGTYWLAYFPNDDNLHFNRAGNGTGKLAYYALPYGPMPATFSTTPTMETEHWSFYGTLTR